MKLLRTVAPTKAFATPLAPVGVPLLRGFCFRSLDKAPHECGTPTKAVSEEEARRAKAHEGGSSKSDGGTTINRPHRGPALKPEQ